MGNETKQLTNSRSASLYQCHAPHVSTILPLQVIRKCNSRKLTFLMIQIKNLGKCNDMMHE